jgi:glycosyltransferase involved in cell wall biosynthesis
MTYPRVLIVALGRINATDTSNNGLLLRNLFASWPRKNLAQVYSSGDNGDNGFFGRYYKLGSQDRRLGSLFYRLKAEAQTPITPLMLSVNEKPISSFGTAYWKSAGKRLLLDTGLYELIFKAVLSSEMLTFVHSFKPDIIFAQGYCLTFTWLPVMLAERFKLPIAYYPTDDWPNETYCSHAYKMPVIDNTMIRIVDKAARNLVDTASVCLAFNNYMQEEYFLRYGKKFTVLMHGDSPQRFETAVPVRLAQQDETWIVATGVFNKNRLPLLEDLDTACEILKRQGVRVRATVFPVNEFASNETNRFKHIEFVACPDHDALPGILKGANILFLPERFDETAQGIRLSVSSKAHLFMFSGTPTVVYSDPVTGIARYAKEDGWGVVVCRRDASVLATAFHKLITDSDYRKSVSDKAIKVADDNHNLDLNCSTFRKIMLAAIAR